MNVFRFNVIRETIDPIVLQNTIIHGIYTNTPKYVIEECIRMCSIGIKYEKNWARAVLFASKFNIPLPLKPINPLAINDIPLSEFNKALISEPSSINTICKTQKDIAFCIMSSDDSYDFKYKIKAELTAFCNRDDSLYMATIYYVVNPLLHRLRNDSLVGPYMATNQILLVLKGSRPIGFIMRDMFPDDIVFRTYGCGGDNDIEIMINPSIHSDLFNVIRARCMHIVRRCVVTALDSLSDVYTTINTSSRIIVPQGNDSPVLMELSLRPKRSSYTVKIGDVHIKRYITRKKRIVTYTQSSNTFVQADGAVVDFYLGRVMTHYTAHMPYTVREENFRCEIMDIGCSSQHDH